MTRPKPKRQTNSGIRKICGCPRRSWSKCSHGWHFSFKWNGVHHRFSLDKHLGRHIDSKSAAEDEAAQLRIAIKAGTFGRPTTRQDLTVRQLADIYLERHVQVERAARLPAYTVAMRTICRTVLPRPTGGRAALGEWPVTDVVTDTIERFREVRRSEGCGPVGVNRNLGALRALFGWAVRVGYVGQTPYKRGTEAVVKLSAEHPRSRRLQPGEEAALLAACGPHLRAVVEAALCTGMRRGEILSLRWRDVHGMTLAPDGSSQWSPRAEIVLRWEQTKTKRERRIPISSRLRAVLDMRRLDAAGEPHPPAAFVFGDETGARVGNIKRAWASAVLKAHGHVPEYTPTANLSPASRATLQQIDLHLHDLRREAGSRWLEGGVPLHTVRDWLGHSNLSQTSTYLSGTMLTQHDAMAAFERLQELATKDGSARHEEPQTDTRRHEMLNKDAIGRDPGIM